jgi:predicted membrane protein
MLLTSSTIIIALEIVIIVEIVANRLSLCIIVVWYTNYVSEKHNTKSSSLVSCSRAKQFILIITFTVNVNG